MELSGGEQKKYNTKFCFIEVGDQHGSEFVELGVRVLPSPCGTLKYLDWNSVKKQFAHLSDLQLPIPVNRGMT